MYCTIVSSPRTAALAEPRRGAPEIQGGRRDIWASLRALLSAIAADRRLAAPVAELRGVPRAGALPGLGVADQRRSRAMGQMRGDPAREQNIDFGLDADDLLVAGRRDLKPRQLRFGAADRCCLSGAFV